jgi:acyl-CoA thioesterase FadM
MDYYPVVVSGEMKYKRQIKLFDKPFGKMEISSYMHGIFILKAEIIVSKVTAFTALQKCVILNLKKNVIFKGDPLLLKNI